MTRDMQKRALLSLFALGSAAMLFGALSDQEYEYYTFLRWVTCFAAVLVALLGLQWGHLWATGVFVFVAILFNPFVPIDLSRSIWRPIDIGAAVLFLLAVPLIKVPGTREGAWRLFFFGAPLMVLFVAGYTIGWLYLFGPHKAEGILLNRLVDCIEARSYLVDERVSLLRTEPMTVDYDHKEAEWVVDMYIPFSSARIAPPPQGPKNGRYQ